MHKTILIIEDDKKISELLRIYCQKDGFRTVQAFDGTDGLEKALQIKPDLIILDRMLPSLEGLEILKKVRQEYEIPFLILSAKSDEIEKIIGLELGADDYLSKPFSPKELMARVKAILRRSSSITSENPGLKFKDLELNPEKMLVTQSGIQIGMSVLEFKLLHFLVKNPGRVFSRDQLIQKLYSSSQSMVFDRTIDAHIKNIRKKLGDNAKKPKYIASVFGAGYKLLDNEI